MKFRELRATSAKVLLQVALYRLHESSLSSRRRKARETHRKPRDLPTTSDVDLHNLSVLEVATPVRFEVVAEEYGRRALMPQRVRGPSLSLSFERVSRHPAQG